MSKLRFIAALFIAVLVSNVGWSYQAPTSPAAKPKPQARTTTKPPSNAAPAKAPSKATGASVAPAPRMSPEEIAKKRQLLQSERYRRAYYAFDEWLTYQKIYPKSEVPRIKAAFRKKVNDMTSRELEGFLGQMEAKLAILNSPEAQSARDWLGYFASAKAVLPPTEVDKFDIMNMSTNELHQWLSEVETVRRSRARASKAYDTVRDTEARQQFAEDQQNLANQQSLAGSPARFGGSGANGASPYAPARQRQQTQNTDNNMHMWLSPYGVSFLIP